MCAVRVFPKMSDWDLRRLAAARNYKYFCEMVKRAIEGTCGLCERAKSKNGVIRESSSQFGREGFVLIQNDFPDKKKTSNHLLVIPKQHLTSLSQMDPLDWCDVVDLVSYAERELKIPGGGVLLRFGDPALNAGTQEHLHFNIIQPNGLVEYRPPLCKKPEEYAEDDAKMAVFKKLWLRYVPR